jgi:hypothetical protein
MERTRERNIRATERLRPEEGSVPPPEEEQEQREERIFEQHRVETQHAASAPQQTAVETSPPMGVFVSYTRGG